MKQQDSREAMIISLKSILVNLALSILKLVAGIVASSAAMISDAVHSASDVFSTVIVIIGLKLSSKAADEDHPYGHDRLECVAGVLLAAVLAVTGLAIGRSGVLSLLSPAELPVPGMLALVAAAVSILVKEGMYRITMATAKRTGSSALKADAWHHRSDALSSIGSLIGIAGARLGLPVLDPIASLVICVFILKAALDIFRDACDKLTDKACDPELEEQMRRVISSRSGVISVDELRTRQFGAGIYVDVEISADGDGTLKHAHDIAEDVHDSIEQSFPNVKHCMVHVNPAKAA